MIIENSKTYNVNDVENLFFRPSFCGKSAEELGIRVIYNMPLPTKIPAFFHSNNILNPFSPGWQGGEAGSLTETEISMKKVKAESAYAADVYFSTIFEMLTNSAEVNLGDLSGTDLEAAETELFRRAIAEGIYSTMWWGDSKGEYSDFTSFDGFLAQLDAACIEGDAEKVNVYNDVVEGDVESLFVEAWYNASTTLRNLASEGHLAFYVSSDVYDQYRSFIDRNNYNVLNTNILEARPVLFYHGIPIIEVPMNGYSVNKGRSFCLLTDSRNLILALNTNDSPEKEIRMWYNPDEMENRQRVVFLAGTAIADYSLIPGSVYNKFFEF